MKNWHVAIGAAALALFSFFLLPGHTYLTQDTQIYVPILENIWNPAVLTRDLLVQSSHVAFTLYDEYAIALRWCTHLDFQPILQTTQLLCRALGIWGVYLIALAILKTRLPALAVAAACSAGAEVWGPAVLVVEFEPSPRAFAIPLVFLAVGLCAHRRFGWAAFAATVAFLFHPTSAAPFWLGFAALRQWRWGVLSLVTGLALLALGAHFQPGMREDHLFLSRVPAPLEAIQRMRSAYNYVGMWIAAEWPRYLACAVVGTLAYLRLRPAIGPELRPFLIGLPALGLLSVPVSYILLDRLKWAFLPQVQPARMLLFLVAFSILLAAAAAFRVSSYGSVAWLALALTPAVFAPRPRYIATPGLIELSRWAAANTPPDAVFLFPEAAHSLEPGLFRSRALRAVYVDWKGGGQANFLPELGLEWFARYRDTMSGPRTLEHYRSLGISYLIYPDYHVVKVNP